MWPQLPTVRDTGVHARVRADNAIGSRGFVDTLFTIARAWLDRQHNVGGEKMAAYHLEALRRQRVIERQAEARLRLERQQVTHYQ